MAKKAPPFFKAPIRIQVMK